MLLTEISRWMAHICNLLLNESINPKRFTLIVKSKNISEKTSDESEKRSEILLDVT